MMKKQSLECVFEYVGRKSIILYGDVCRYGAISGTHIAIVEFLEEVIDLEKTLEYAEDDCYVAEWTAIFTDNSTTERNREIKTFRYSWDFIEYAKAFFTTPSPVESDTPPESQAETP